MAESMSRRLSALEDLAFYLGRAYYNYINVLERALRDAKLDRYLVPGMGHVLFALFEHDDCIIKDIVERTSLAPSTLTAMLNRMERSGLVKRHPDLADRRATRVKLTKLGRSLEPACWEVQNRIQGILQAGITADEGEALRRLLARIMDNLRSG